ncbi:hypothetical protein CJU89_5193 [Yarrowia sp. B02]|nr:hypothetical protein CJU89_5193 [Yarrowia sp. B02]
MPTHPEVAEWLEKYPASKGTAPLASKEQVLKWLKEDNKTAIIDLRKHDYLGGQIKGAFGFHYTGVHGSVEDIWKLLKAAGKTRIVVHCWSSRQRAVKVAGWFYDSLVDEEIEVYVLEGGIKGWVAGGKEYTDQMVEFDPAVFE